MERKTADKLIGRLGMTYEMAPLLTSFDDGYQRFEKTIGIILQRITGTSPVIRTNKQRKLYYVHTPGESPSFGWNKYKRKKDVPSDAKEVEIDRTPVSLSGTKTLDTSLEVFKRLYGIGVQEEDIPVIAEEMNLGERASRHSCVKLRGDFVLEILKQQHKKDIWYGVLGE